MKIGLLQCDHIRQEFQHLIHDYSDAFEALFKHHAPALSLKVYDVCHGKLPRTPTECEGYVITGSRHSVYDDIDWIHQLSAFVRQVYDEKCKLVGICFGHQMIAHALGGKVAKADNGWGIGIKAVNIEKPKAWMQPSQNQYQLLLSHQDQVIELPDEGEVLGGNAHCPVSMFTVGESMLGIQAHPEFTCAYADAVMKTRVERIGQDVVQAALSTLSTPTDESYIAQWIQAFLEQPQ